MLEKTVIYIWLSRYNDYDDLTGLRKPGAVSYNLNSLNVTSETKGIKLKINSEKEWRGGTDVRPGGYR